jgi:plastocyanin
MITRMLALVALVLLVGSCAGGTAPPPSATASVTAPAAPVPQAATPTAAASPPVPAVSATEGSVTVQNFAFQPPQLTIAVGTTVTWTNHDTANHQIALDDGSFTGQSFGQGAITTHAFAAAGSFPYHCKIHPSMKGTIVVQ